MSRPPADLAKNEIAFYFDTNQAISARDIGEFFITLEQFARTHGHLNPEAVLELVDAGRGTFWSRFALLSGIVGSVAGIGSFAIDVAGAMQEPTGDLPKCIAHIVIEHGVRAVTVIDCNGGIEVLRDAIPMVQMLEQESGVGARMTGVASPGTRNAPADGDEISVTSRSGPVAFGFGEGVARVITPESDGVKRDPTLTERRLTRSGESFLASPKPPETGKALPVTTSENTLVNFAHSEIDARGYVLRIGKSPVAFEIVEILNGGHVTKMVGPAGD